MNERGNAALLDEDARNESGELGMESEDLVNQNGDLAIVERARRIESGGPEIVRGLRVDGNGEARKLRKLHRNRGSSLRAVPSLEAGPR